MHVGRASQPVRDGLERPSYCSDTPHTEFREPFYQVTGKLNGMEHDAGADLVDIIDDVGRTVRTATRREMRSQGLPHRCVYILVLNRQGELYIHQRTDSKDVFPGYWDVAVGGVLAAGETFIEGAAREGREELGVDLACVPVFEMHYKDAATTVQGMVYRAVHDGPFRLQPEEIVRGEFRPMEEVIKLTGEVPFCPDGLAVLRKYRELT